MVGIVFHRGVKGGGIVAMIVRFYAMAAIIMGMVVFLAIVACPVVVMGVGMLMQMAMVVKMTMLMAMLKTIGMAMKMAMGVDMGMIVQMFMGMAPVHRLRHLSLAKHFLTRGITAPAPTKRQRVSRKAIEANTAAPQARRLGLFD
jgi:hypothetical protein